LTVSSSVRPLDAAPAVPHNRWDLLAPPDLGAWEPRMRVSVVIPYYERPRELARTLAALEAQTYPRELIEVIVADDGSEPALDLAGDQPTLDVRVVRQERRGFGAARARNLGASVATGTVLVFLDVDMLPEPDHLEAHARWHHICDHAVTLGPRRHVEVDDLTPNHIGEAARQGSLAALFADRPSVSPSWIEGHLERTDHLRGAHDDLFRVVTSGNVGVSAATFLRCGGFDASFGQWGGEDTELGYRLFVGGAVLVHEEGARCWHQGEGHEPSPEELRSLDEQRARLAHLIAHRGFRSVRRGRSYLVPRVAVEVAVPAGTGRATAVGTVEAVLASDLHDLVVQLQLDADHQDAEWLRRQFAADPRVLLPGEDLGGTPPVRLELPAGAVLEAGTLDRLVERLSDPDDPLGVLRLTVPRRRPREVHATAWLTRAQARMAASGITDPTSQLVAAGELFGERWVSGYDVGLTWASDPHSVEAVADAAPSRPAGDVHADANQLWQLVSRLDDRQRRQLLGAARSVLGQLSPPQLAFLLRVARWCLAVLSALAAFRRVRGPRSLWRASIGLVRALVPDVVRRPFRRLARRVLRRPRTGDAGPREGHERSDRRVA
jgi:glycosyltransferase involved in cell wall biosynthesis